MKASKFALVLVVGLPFFLGVSAGHAEGPMGDGPGGGPGGDRGIGFGTPERFTEMKANMLERLNSEKAMAEKMIVCVTAAQKSEDMKKCHEERRAAMDVLREKEKQWRKKQLQEEIKRLDQPTQKK